VKAPDYKDSTTAASGAAAGRDSADRVSGTRAKLSAVLITQDAASQIEACLASVAFADEILVVDSGSSDDTLAIAQRHGARVLHHDWPGYGAQKQFAVEQAAHDWVLCVDADERITQTLQENIAKTIVSQRFPAYRMARANVFMGRVLRHGEGYPDWSLRLFDRRHARWSDDPVHESVIPAAPDAVGTLAGDLMHESSETLASYLAKQNKYTSLQAERLFRDGKRAGWARIALAPLVRFIKFYVVRLGFLDGVPGLVHIFIGCQNSMLKYAKLREMAETKKSMRSTAR
jgi:glycosyltransferase involved in cell wall biosynthesis